MAELATIGPTSRKELLWLSCREKSCCHTTKVVLSGLDMWRINVAMELMPWQYTRYSDAPDDALASFCLEQSGPRFQVVLDKRGAVGPSGAPCIFLLKMKDSHAQCGLGALRPTVCKVYPATLVDNLLRCESSACTCRRWSLLDLDVERDTSLLQAMLQEAAEYTRIVSDWNSAVESGHDLRTYREFCTYVIDAYRALYGGGQ
jgi:Fe-S-cluster containining protein